MTGITAISSANTSTAGNLKTIAIENSTGQYTYINTTQNKIDEFNKKCEQELLKTEKEKPLYVIRNGACAGAVMAAIDYIFAQGERSAKSAAIWGAVGFAVGAVASIIDFKTVKLEKMAKLRKEFLEEHNVKY